MNLASVLKTNAHKYGQKPAIRCGSQTYSYTEVWLLTERIAQYLQSLGVHRGDRVGLSLAESTLHLVAHYAIARLGAIIVPMDHRWTRSEKIAAATAFRTCVVLVEANAEPVDEIGTAILTTDRLPDNSDDLAPINDENSDLLISLSSGTTGKPKGALITHRHLYERFVSQWHAIGYGENDTFAVLTPFYFGAGRSFGMSLLAAGGTVLIAPPPLKPPQIVTALSDPRVTATFLPPTLLRRLIGLQTHDSGTLFPNLNYLIASGEPLHADEALQCIEKICVNLYSYYASSEGGGISVLHPEDFQEFAMTVGRPTYKTEVEIVDGDDNELGVRQVGRLRYRGPGVSTRFLDGDGNEHDTAIGGWFYPGDLAEKLASGHIALRGRDKDVIIRGGANVYPAEIEAVLLQHPNVSDAAVVGYTDAARGEIVKAFVLTIEPQDTESLERWSSEYLAPYKRPQAFVILDEMPKSNSGKTDKKALLNL